MKKENLILFIIFLLFFIWRLFFWKISEGIIYGIFALSYVASIFIISSVRKKRELDSFLKLADKLKNYFFPGFMLYSSLLLLLLTNNELYLPWAIIGWYCMLFLFENIMILIPTFEALNKNINSFFARIYFVLSILFFGIGYSVLSGGIAGTVMGKNWNWIPLTLDNIIFTVMGYVELFVGLFLIFYFFKIKRE